MRATVNHRLQISECSQTQVVLNGVRARGHLCPYSPEVCGCKMLCAGSTHANKVVSVLSLQMVHLLVNEPQHWARGATVEPARRSRYASRAKEREGSICAIQRLFTSQSLVEYLAWRCRDIPSLFRRIIVASGRRKLPVVQEST